MFFLIFIKIFNQSLGLRILRIDHFWGRFLLLCDFILFWAQIWTWYSLIFLFRSQWKCALTDSWSCKNSWEFRWFDYFFASWTDFWIYGPRTESIFHRLGALARSFVKEFDWFGIPGMDCGLVSRSEFVSDTTNFS